jgi:hypothetical protein
VNLLHQVYPDEIDVLFEVISKSRPQVVVLSSFWSEVVVQFMHKVLNPVLLITCGIEAFVRAGINLASSTFIVLISCYSHWI